MFGISTGFCFFFIFFEDKEGKKIIKEHRVNILNSIYNRPGDRASIGFITGIEVFLFKNKNIFYGLVSILQGLIAYTIFFV